MYQPINGDDGMTSWTELAARFDEEFRSVSHVLRSFFHGSLALAMAAALSGCWAKEPRQINLSEISYNYTDQTVFRVSVNGQGVRMLMDGVQPRGVSGGGVVCCVQLPEGATEAQVEVDLGDAKYTTRAKIQKWWPDLAHYAVVHVLPGRKVVIKVRSVDTWPRQDLLNEQLKAAGLVRKIRFSGPMNEGPMERTDDVK